MKKARDSPDLGPGLSQPPASSLAFMPGMGVL